MLLILILLLFTTSPQGRTKSSFPIHLICTGPRRNLTQLLRKSRPIKYGLVLL